MQPMDPRRWEEVQAAFDALVELDGPARAGRLATLGAADPDLRVAVESLLAGDAAADARLASLEAPFLSAAPTPDPLGLTGRTVSHFRVVEPLGAGGMGVVYRAEDTRLGRAVALKFPLPNYNLDATAKTRFLREARAAAALDHPHLCTIYDVGESEDGRLFLAMALYTGETIKARLARDGPLPVKEALAITKQIARGLACAHGAGIVHRDLKPGNVMLLPDGTVKILDFGLAKALDESTSKTSGALGTVAYMAPEQIQGETVDTRTDLWAVGVVLYEMLTGQKPFAGEHEVAIAHAIVHDQPVAPTTLRDGLPAAVEEVVQGLLEKDPRARYAAVDELLADLAAAGPLDDTTMPRVRARRRRPPNRLLPRALWMVSLAAVLAVGGVGWLALDRWLRPPPVRPVSRYLSLPDAEALDLSETGHYRIAISPDGQRLVYVGATPQGGRRLWVRELDQLHATPLAGTDGAFSPFFSPDGSRLGFVAVAPGLPSLLKVVPVGGGAPITVTDSGVVPETAAWGHDGYIYFHGSNIGGLARIRETGGAPETITVPVQAQGEWWHYQPEPLPSGRGVLFTVGRGGGGSLDIAVVDLQSRVHRVLIRGGVSPRYAASGHLIYVRADGTLMAAPFDQDKLALTGEAVPLAEQVGMPQEIGMQDLAVSPTGTLVYAWNTGMSKELVWVARDGRTTPIDPAWHARFKSFALSPSGTELAVGVQEAGATNIWIKRLDRGPAAMLGSEGGDVPAWTPNGQGVTFVSSRLRSNANLDLWVARADGTELPRLLWHDARSIEDAGYSRDGQWLVYRTGFDLFAVRTSGDTTPIPLVATRFLESSPRLSPDGRWLAYTSSESGDLAVYVRPFPNVASGKWRVSTGGSSADPAWSRDGRELFYKNGHGELVAVTVLPGATFAVGGQRALFKYDEYENYWNVRDYDVSPDGRRFVMIRKVGKRRDELIVVENFFEELKERPPPTR